jgi:2Fe-2S ferredoxin
MPKVTFVQPDGTRRTVEGPSGTTGMDLARSHGIRGLRGECGGEVLCSTCHCYVDEAWLERLPPRHDKEAQLIDFVWEPRTQSRLSCQLVLTEELDGLVLHVPTHQI